MPGIRCKAWAQQMAFSSDTASNLLSTTSNGFRRVPGGTGRTDAFLGLNFVWSCHILFVCIIIYISCKYTLFCRYTCSYIFSYVINLWMCWKQTFKWTYTWWIYGICLIHLDPKLIYLANGKRVTHYATVISLCEISFTPRLVKHGDPIISVAVITISLSIINILIIISYQNRIWINFGIKPFWLLGLTSLFELQRSQANLFQGQASVDVINQRRGQVQQGMPGVDDATGHVAALQDAPELTPDLEIGLLGCGFPMG